MSYNPFEMKKIIDKKINPYYANIYTLFGVERNRIEKVKSKKLTNLNKDIKKFKDRIRNRAITEIDINETEKILIDDEKTVDAVLAVLNNEEKIFNNPEARVLEELKIHPFHRNNKNDTGEELSKRITVLKEQKLSVEMLREEFKIPKLEKFIVFPPVTTKEIEFNNSFNKECKFIKFSKELSVEEDIKLSYF